jgi:hypothetical protein
MAAESDGTPVRFERMEPEVLWDDVRVAYAWNTWWAVDGGGAYPVGAYRIIGGTVVSRRGIPFGGAALISADSAPLLLVPSAPAMSLRMGSGFEVPPPDTVRVGDKAFLLRARDYTHAVVWRRDTVFLLDATTSEARAREDSTWIATLFPGAHPVVLVVTDHAWPHIAGVRFWVARGATVVSHWQSEDLLRKVVSWRLNPPDALEQGKPRAGLVFRGVSDSLRLAGGDLVAHALQGLSTEGALGVWLPAEAFFWAGDYVQSLTKPTVYGRDVVRTLDALRIAPVRFGAEHVPIGEWTALRALQSVWP